MIVTVVAGILVFQITSNITYSISDTFYVEIGNLNNVQVENYILKQYKDNEFKSINDLFKIFRSDFSFLEQYQVAKTLVNSICIENCINGKKILYSWSFYVLLILVALYVWFLSKYYKNIDTVEKFKDKAFCNAYINSQGFPILMKKFQEDAKTKSITELCDTLKSFQEVSK